MQSSISTKAGQVIRRLRHINALGDGSFKAGGEHLEIGEDVHLFEPLGKARRAKDQCELVRWIASPETGAATGRAARRARLPFACIDAGQGSEAWGEALRSSVFASAGSKDPARGRSGRASLTMLRVRLPQLIPRLLISCHEIIAFLRGIRTLPPQHP